MMLNKTLFILTLVFCSLIVKQLRAEKLMYDIRFGFIKGGEAVYQTKETPGNDKEEVHAELHGYTTGFAKKIYGVDDYFESFINKGNYLPTKSFKKLKEQNFRLNEEVTFDQAEGVAFSKKSGALNIKRGICDVSSIMYHLQNSGRLDHLKKNQVIEIPFWDTGEWYILSLKYTGLEKISTYLGKKECLRLEPQKIAGRFFNKRNPMNIWITNDSRKLPVLMELNFTIGSVKCELKEAQQN
jgi:hypothetical protein